MSKSLLNVLVFIAPVVVGACGGGAPVEDGQYSDPVYEFAHAYMPYVEQVEIPLEVEVDLQADQWSLRFPLKLTLSFAAQPSLNGANVNSLWTNYCLPGDRREDGLPLIHVVPALSQERESTGAATNTFTFNVPVFEEDMPTDKYVVRVYSAATRESGGFKFTYPYFPVYGPPYGDRFTYTDYVVNIVQGGSP